MKKWNHSLGATVAVMALAFSSSAQTRTAAHKSQLTIEQLIDIKHPSDPIWSPDAKRVAFVWDRAGVANLYVANIDGHGQPMPLTSFTQGQVKGAFWNEDGDIVYFPHDGDLWQVAASGGAPKPVWNKPDPGSDFVACPDGKRVAFVRNNKATPEGAPHGSDLIIRRLSDGIESTTAHDDVSIHGILWSADGSSIAYTGGSKVIHHDESPSYSGAKLIYRVSEDVPGQIYALKLAGGKSVAIGKPGDYGGLAWLDATHLVFDGQSTDFKKYFIYLADAADGSTRAIHEVDEEKFWSIPDWGEAGAQPWPSPNGKWIAFLSDQDGWDHLYIMSASGGKAVQITKGRFEAWRPAWSHDSTRIAFDANVEDHPGDRQIGIATIPSTQRSCTSRRSRARISSRTGPMVTRASSTSTPIRTIAPIFSPSARAQERSPSGSRTPCLRKSTAHNLSSRNSSTTRDLMASRFPAGSLCRKIWIAPKSIPPSCGSTATV